MKGGDIAVTHISDEEIIELYWQRNETAINKTDEKYGKMLLSAANGILNDLGASEECKNDTYLELWNMIPPERPRIFPAFITRILRNTAIDRYRKRKSRRNAPSEFELALDELYDCISSNETPLDIIEADELSGLISRYVKTLSKRNRYIFISRFYLCESPEEIADTLFISRSGVYKAIDRIKIGLKAYLYEKGYEGGGKND